MTEADRLIAYLRKWDRRLRLTQALRWAPRSLLAAALAALIVALVARFRPLLTQPELLQLSGALAAAALVIMGVVVVLAARDRIQRARRFDVLFGLRERTSTALELASGTIPIESQQIAQSQLQEALAAAARVNPAEKLPFQSDWREWTGVGLLSVALAAAILIPNPQQTILEEQAEVEQAIAEEIEDLIELQERIEADETLTAEEIAALSEVLEDTIQELDQPGTSQQEALAALDEAEQNLRDLSEEFAESRQDALEEASGQFEGTAAEEAAEALAQDDALAAAEALSNLNLDQLSPEELDQLAESLEQAADQLAESNPELAEQLQEAADAIQNGDTAAAQEALEDAAESVAESGGSSVEQVDELADEVDKSQADVAGAGSASDQAGQPGEGGMGQAGQGQQGQSGQPGQEGEGQVGGGSGRGESEGAVGGAPEGDEAIDTDNGPGDGGTAEYEGIYAPERVGGEGGEEVDIPGDPGAGAPTGTEGDFADNPDGDSTVPYDDVFADYEGAANEAIESGYIPLGMRDIIRDYFSRLDPDN